MKRDLISIEDLSNAEIISLFRWAAEVERGAASKALEGAILATLFLEPSTRTRLSFEAAMHRLGGAVITSADPQASSSSKGETLADTVRMVDAYADVIVLRHPAEGAARAASRVAKAPILNAGDGGREHPSQTLVDLYTLQREVGRLDSLRVVLYGDLRYGRTAHSLVRGLCRFGARIVALAEPGLELPEYIVRRLESQGMRVDSIRPHGLEALFPGGFPSAVLIEPGTGTPPQERWAPAAGEIDAIYVTRLQRERLPSSRGDRPVLPPVDARFLSVPAFARAIVMHPLPRTSEIDPRIDADRRAAYFRQAAFGVPVRMALLCWALGRVDFADGRAAAAEEAVSRPPPGGSSCADPACISVREPSSTPAEYTRARDGSPRCSYCESPWPNPISE